MSDVTMTGTSAAETKSTVAVEVLTDEELAILDGPGGIVVTPYLGQMDPRERESAVARTTALTQDFWYAHVVEDVCLLEEVTSDGLHRFALCGAGDLPDVVVAACVHPDAGDGRGAPVTFDPVAPDDPTPPPALVESMGEALLRSDLVVRTVGDDRPPLWGLFTGPRGSWVSRAGRGTRANVEVRPCAAQDLRDELRQVVAEALAQARRIGTRGSEGR